MNRIILDVETTGTIDEPLVYDLGFQLVDSDFNVILERNYVVRDIFFGMSDKMVTAYYAEKLPQYHIEIANGTRTVENFIDIYKHMKELCKTYNVLQVWAYNARFDRLALNHTIEILSNGFVSWFMPYGVEWECIQGAAVSTFLNSRRFFKFAIENNMVSSSGNVRTTAEAAYSYLIREKFTEAHTGLEDVKIEAAILQKALAQHKKMNTKPSRTHWRTPQSKFKAYTA